MAVPNSPPFMTPIRLYIYLEYQPSLAEFPTLELVMSTEKEKVERLSVKDLIK
jgi:hypothetical protein